MALALLGIILLCSPILRGRLAGIIMLFTQKSVHTLAGALRSAGRLAVPCVLLLAVFQSAALPWLPRLLPLANGMVFGSIAGFSLSLIGMLAGGSLCFAASRLLLHPLAARTALPGAGRWMTRWGGTVICAALLLFPGATGFVGYLAGISGLPFRRYLASSAAGETITLLMAALFCSPYRTLLPKSVRLALVGIAILVACVGGKLQNFTKRGNP